MKYSVVIPAHNEEDYLPALLESLSNQSLLPQEVIMVDDNSDDDTQSIMQSYCERFSFFYWIAHQSSGEHLPGSKVIRAFYAGYMKLTKDYQVIVKLDADLILPSHYFEQVMNVFQDTKAGIVGGCLLEKNKKGEWELNHPMNTDHIRGAIKAYHKNCFKAIGGLQRAMGWDTLDEHLARYYQYDVQMINTLHVKHLRPLGKKYLSKAAKTQGSAYYLMRYGFLLSLLAALKAGWVKRSFKEVILTIRGYLLSLQNSTSPMVSPEEGKFIRAYRWKQIWEKLKGKNN